MSSIWLRVVAFMFLTIVCAAPSAAQAPEADSEEPCPLSIDTNLGFFSAYMFRGQRLYDGTSIQPAVNAEYTLEDDMGVLAANIWAHLPGRSDHQDEKFSEVDYTISYSLELDPISIALGNVWYTIPHDNTGAQESTPEVFVALSTEIEKFVPSVSFFQDYHAYDSQYYEFRVEREVEIPQLGEGFKTTPYVDIGWSSNAHKVYDRNGIEQITFGTSFAAALGDVAVIPEFHYTRGIDDTTSSTFWMGVSLGYSF